MKNILSTILLLLATMQLFADDGGSTNDYFASTYLVKLCIFANIEKETGYSNFIEHIYKRKFILL